MDDLTKEQREALAKAYALIAEADGLLKFQRLPAGGALHEATSAIVRAESILRDYRTS
jgi:hypothetical protein